MCVRLIIPNQKKKSDSERPWNVLAVITVAFDNWKIETGGYSCTIRKKSLLYLQSVTKNFAKCKKTEQTWTRPEYIKICFCVSFKKCSLKIILMLPIKFEIFFSFANYQRS